MTFDFSQDTVAHDQIGLDDFHLDTNSVSPLRDCLTARKAKRSAAEAKKSAVIGILPQHVEKAGNLMTEGAYRDAYNELVSAAARLATYQEAVDAALEDALDHLVELDYNSNTPHPVALPMMRLLNHLRD